MATECAKFTVDKLELDEIPGTEAALVVADMSLAALPLKVFTEPPIRYVAVDSS